MSLLFKIYSISLANPLLCLLPILVIFRLLLLFWEEYSMALGSFVKLKLNLDPNYFDFHGFRDSFSTKMTTE